MKAKDAVRAGAEVAAPEGRPVRFGGFGPPHPHHTARIVIEQSDETPREAARDEDPERRRLPRISGGADGGVEAAIPGAADRRRDWVVVLGKVASLAVALFLFVLAIQVMKDGAKALGPTFRDSPLFSNAYSTLGAGWLGAYVVLSGSPIAAVALSLFYGGALTKLQTFSTLSGSRLGASFVVLLVGFLYALRNRGANRGESVGMGILAISTGQTYAVFYPLLLIGAISTVVGFALPRAVKRRYEARELRRMQALDA